MPTIHDEREAEVRVASIAFAHEQFFIECEARGELMRRRARVQGESGRRVRHARLRPTYHQARAASRLGEAVRRYAGDAHPAQGEGGRIGRGRRWTTDVCYTGDEKA